MTRTPLLFAFTLLLIVSASHLCAQTTPDTASADDMIMPTYDATRLEQSIRYPEIARNNNITGTVHIKFFVDEQGRPSRIEATESSSPILSKAAIDAVSKMTFNPAQRLGKPVSCWMTIPVNFTLGDASDSEAPLASSNEIVEFRPSTEVIRLPADPSGKTWEASELRASELPRYHAPGLAETLRYPEEAREAGRKGTVVISVIIDTDGRAGEPRIILSTDPLFDAAALEALSQFRFIPGTRDGKRVRVRLAVPVDFKLPK
jgi:TonB family protein